MPASKLGSAVRAVRNGGYGSVINIPTSEPILLSGPCGAFCSNYDAEIAAIQRTLDTLLEQFRNGQVRPLDIVIFSDSLSAIQAIENWHGDTAKGIEDIIQANDHLMNLYGIQITIQWIPGHSDIQLNDKADGLAKMGSHMPQENVNASFETAKQVAKQNSKEVWHNSWIEEEKGRRMYAYLPTPNPKDPINKLARRDQCNIFRLRTGHVNLNFHRNRIDPLYAPMCRHCMYPYETVEHYLLYCNRLSELRDRLLPPNPTIENCLYSNSIQLKKTSQSYLEASRVS